MTIQQCRYVLEIARTGSFSRAARQLFIAQSSLSMSIKSLESELNIRIFDRSANGVYLTEEGAEFVRYATRIVDTEHIVAKRYSSPHLRPRLYVATQHYDFVADAFARFIERYPAQSYKFSIKEIETYNIISEVETARSDVGILAIADTDADIMHRYLSKKNLSFTPLITVCAHVFLRREHPLARCERLSHGELAAYPYVSYEQGEHNSAFFAEEPAAPHDAEKHIEISDRATLMNVLLTTDAYTVGTGIMPSALNSEGRILALPLDGGESCTVGYIVNNERRLSETASEFITHLEKTIKDIKQ